MLQFRFGPCQRKVLAYFAQDQRESGWRGGNTLFSMDCGQGSGGVVIQVMAISVAWATEGRGVTSGCACGSGTGTSRQSSRAIGMMWAGEAVEAQCATATNMMWAGAVMGAIWACRHAKPPSGSCNLLTGPAMSHGTYYIRGVLAQSPCTVTPATCPRKKAHVPQNRPEAPPLTLIGKCRALGIYLYMAIYITIYGFIYCYILLYMAIYSNICDQKRLHMTTYTLKYVVWTSGHVFWVSGLVFWVSGLVFWGSGLVFGCLDLYLGI